MFSIGRCADAADAVNTGTRSFAARTVGDWNQLPAVVVVVEQENPASFKNQLDMLAPVACRNACTSRPIGHSVKRLQSTDISRTALAYIYNPMPWLLGLACV